MITGSRRAPPRGILGNVGNLWPVLESQPLKLGEPATDKPCMTMAVACLHCAHKKPPLRPCPECQAHAPAEYDLTAWRAALHAHHLARITAPPVAPAVRLERPAPRPLRVVVTLTESGAAVVRTPEIDLGSGLPAAAPLSFDWSDPEPVERGLLRLRRTA